MAYRPATTVIDEVISTMQQMQEDTEDQLSSLQVKVQENQTEKVLQRFPKVRKTLDAKFSNVLKELEYLKKEVKFLTVAKQNLKAKVTRLQTTCKVPDTTTTSNGKSTSFGFQPGTSTPVKNAAAFQLSQAASSIESSQNSMVNLFDDAYDLTLAKFLEMSIPESGDHKTDEVPAKDSTEPPASGNESPARSDVPSNTAEAAALSSPDMPNVTAEEIFKALSESDTE